MMKLWGDFDRIVQRKPTSPIRLFWPMRYIFMYNGGGNGLRAAAAIVSAGLTTTATTATTTHGVLSIWIMPGTLTSLALIRVRRTMARQRPPVDAKADTNDGDDESVCA